MNETLRLCSPEGIIGGCKASCPSPTPHIPDFFPPNKAKAV